MKGFILLAQLMGLSAAYPNMKAQMDEISEIVGRQAPQPSTELIGDLKTLSDSQLTTVGKNIKSILTVNGVSPTDATTRYTPPSGGKDGAACKADTCCIWSYIVADMVTAFKGSSGRCTGLARSAVRLGFHDAGTWSKSSTFGGADGSILLSDEINRSDNNGLQSIATQTKSWYNTYKSYGISMADLIQMGANVATVVCPRGPRVKTFVGRKDNSQANPTGLLPQPTQAASALISLFNAKTITGSGLVALLGSHSVSQQRTFNTARAGDPQDTTPGVWDVAFYNTTLQSSVPPKILKFPSDVALSTFSSTQSTWSLFVTNANVWATVCANPLGCAW